MPRIVKCVFTIYSLLTHRSSSGEQLGYLEIIYENHREFSTVCMRKKVVCHFFVATVLGLASEVNLIVVKKHFR